MRRLLISAIALIIDARNTADLLGHSGPLLDATKDIDISEAAVLAKLVLS